MRGVTREPTAPTTPDTPARRAARLRLRRSRVSGRPPPQADHATRIRATVAYDGTDYSGWQRQRDRVSVQEVLEVGLRAATGDASHVVGAGRTDAGVHARGQVVSLETRTTLEPSAIAHRWNQVLPDDVQIVAATAAPKGFDPRRHAVRKLYRYTLLLSAHRAPAAEHTAWRVPPALDLEAMRTAAAVLVGRHDFRAFRNDPGLARRDENTVRTITRLAVDPWREYLVVEAEGPGFLYMMVRNLVGALVNVGRGRACPAGEAAAWIAGVLESRDRSQLPPPAPAHGLCLMEVEYPDPAEG